MYVVYHKDSTQIVGNTYKTVGAAKAAITRRSKTWFNKDYAPNYPNIARDADPIFVYAIAEINHYYANIERTVTRKNMMSGVEYTESVNTPLCCSPSSETYWSM